jgi:hypothetical protein
VLAVPVRLVTALVSGVAGVVVGAAIQAAVAGEWEGAAPDVLFACSSAFAAVAVVSVLSLLGAAPNAAFDAGAASLGPPHSPWRAMRGFLARCRRRSQKGRCRPWAGAAQPGRSGRRSDRRPARAAPRAAAPATTPGPARSSRRARRAHPQSPAFADGQDARHIERLTDQFILAFISASIGLVSVLLLALPARAITLNGANISQAIGYAGLTVATLLGLRVLAAIGRHCK